MVLLSFWYFMASVSSLSVNLLTGAHVLLFIGVYLLNGSERSANMIKRSLHAQASLVGAIAVVLTGNSYIVPSIIPCTLPLLSNMMYNLYCDFLDETNIAEVMGDIRQELHDATTIIPFVSQVKSAVYAIKGNTAEARETQEKFSKRFPVVSQARSLVEVVKGRPDMARETQTEFLENIRNYLRFKAMTATTDPRKNNASNRKESVPFRIISKASGKALNNNLHFVENVFGFDVLWFEQDGFIFNNDRSAVLDISGFSSAKAFFSSRMDVIMYPKKSSDNVNQQWIIGSNGLIESKARGFFLKEENETVHASSNQPYTFWVISPVAADELVCFLKTFSNPLIEKQNPDDARVLESPINSAHIKKTEPLDSQVNDQSVAEQMKTESKDNESSVSQESTQEFSAQSSINAVVPSSSISNVHERRYPEGCFLITHKGKFLTKDLALKDDSDESKGILWRETDGFIENMETSKVLDICEYSKLKGMVQAKFPVILYSRKANNNENQKWILRKDGVIESRVGNFFLKHDGAHLLVTKDQREKWDIQFK